MSKLQITGSKRGLYGHVPISGSKNAALLCLCASLLNLTERPLTLRNIPVIGDVKSMLELLLQMGAKVWYPNPNDCTQVIIQTAGIRSPEVPHVLAKRMRATIVLLGPLLLRFGSASVPWSGGCRIGKRPVDQHIKGLKMMGAQVETEGEYVRATVNTRLRGAHITMDIITVTGSAHLLMTAVLAEGQTIIKHASIEPEVTDLAMLLVSMGAKIEGIGTRCLVIQGVDALHGAEYEVIPDRIETGTFLCAVAITGGEITLKNCQPSTLEAVINKLTEVGLSIKTTPTEIYAIMTHRPKAVSFITSEYPGFPTDMQAPFMALNSVAVGNCTVTESIFDRFMHVTELNRLGARISIQGNTATLEGVEKLSGGTVKATDLRAAACLVIAALVADGTTSVEGISHLDRGYERMEHKLRALGADIGRV